MVGDFTGEKLVSIKDESKKISLLVMSVTDEDFESVVIESDLPVLVDFWAPWCGPCKAIAPVLEEVAAIFVDKVSFFKMNIDDNPHAPAKYQVRSIPTLILFVKGEKLEVKVGMQTRDSLEFWLEAVVRNLSL